MALKTDEEIDRMSPVEVMLDVMRIHYRDGQRAMVMKPSLGQSLMRRAALVAASVAPYVHPRLATLVAADADRHVKPLDAWTEDELRMLLDGATPVGKGNGALPARTNGSSSRKPS